MLLHPTAERGPLPVRRALGGEFELLTDDDVDVQVELFGGVCPEELAARRRRHPRRAMLVLLPDSAGPTRTVALFDAGADNVVVGASSAELVAHVLALVRRQRPTPVPLRQSPGGR